MQHVNLCSKAAVDEFAKVPVMKKKYFLKNN
jgi:hypothetical protein